MYRLPNIASTQWLRTIRNWSAASARSLVCRLWRSQEGNTPLRNCPIPLIKGSLCHYRYFIHVHQIRSNYTRTGRRSTHWQFEAVDATMRHWSVMLVENQVLYGPGLLKPGFLVIYAKTIHSSYKCQIEAGFMISFVEWAMNLPIRLYLSPTDIIMIHFSIYRFIYVYFVNMSCYRILNLV